MFRYGKTQTTHSPAPEVSILVRSPGKAEPGAFIQGVIDTGAVITCLPIELAGFLRTDVYNWRTVTFASGSQRVKSVSVHLRIGECDFVEHEVLLVERPYALIGRDIINQFELTLNGPDLTWRVNGQCE